jgi:hypothetical protein
MTLDDLTPDRELTDALRQFDHTAAPTPAELHALAHKIVSRARPLLQQRRAGTLARALGRTAAQALAWWEYPAAWARTLIPLGVTTALMAVACILWASLARLPVAPPGVATSVPMRGVEAENMVSQRVLYSLVAPLEQQVVPIVPVVASSRGAAR